MAPYSVRMREKCEKRNSLQILKIKIFSSDILMLLRLFGELAGRIFRMSIPFKRCENV